MRLVDWGSIFEGRSFMLYSNQRPWLSQTHSSTVRTRSVLLVVCDRVIGRRGTSPFAQWQIVRGHTAKPYQKERSLFHIVQSVILLLGRRTTASATSRSRWLFFLRLLSMTMIKCMRRHRLSRTAHWILNSCEG